MPEMPDTVIVGDGQSGLAMSYHLRQRGREHVILERRGVAERWRTERWDSLRLQFSNRWLELPGKPYVGTDPDGFAHSSDVVRFILDYAAETEAPVHTGVEVTSLSPGEGNGGYRSVARHWRGRSDLRVRRRHQPASPAANGSVASTWGCGWHPACLSRTIETFSVRAAAYPLTSAGSRVPALRRSGLLCGS